MNVIICSECDQPMTAATRTHRLESAITLHGVTVLQCPCGSAPIYPKVGQLARLRQHHPEAQDFKWDDQACLWSVWAAE